MTCDNTQFLTEHWVPVTRDCRIEWNGTVYIDDILIATIGSLEQHKQKVYQVLRKLEDNARGCRAGNPGPGVR
jgi:hypothetical protein